MESRWTLRRRTNLLLDTEAPDAESEAVDAPGDDGAGMPHAHPLPMKHAITTAQPHEVYSV